MKPGDTIRVIVDWHDYPFQKGSLHILLDIKKGRLQYHIVITNNKVKKFMPYEIEKVE